MMISPFNPVFFLGQMKRSGAECPFTQVFSCSDTIVLEVLRDSSEDAVPCLVHYIGDDSPMAVTAASHKVNSGTHVDCYRIAGLSAGTYYISVGDDDSEVFIVTDDGTVLDKTVLIEYSPADNSCRNDVIATVGEERIFFGFRIPGGFRDDGWEFSIDNEQFITPMSDIVELYGRESTQKTLTMGFSQGVPIWYGQLLNRILTCRYVYIDGVRYARYESSVPEKTQTLAGVNSFVFTQKLQEIRHLYSPYADMS